MSDHDLHEAEDRVPTSPATRQPNTQPGTGTNRHNNNGSLPQHPTRQRTLRKQVTVSDDDPIVFNDDVTADDNSQTPPPGMAPSMYPLIQPKHSNSTPTTNLSSTAQQRSMSVDSDQGSSGGRRRLTASDILPKKFLLRQRKIPSTPQSPGDHVMHGRLRTRQPCVITCCSRHQYRWPQLLTWSRCCEQKAEEDDFDIPFEDEPFRKRCCRACFTFVYVLLATVAVVVTYSMVQDLITSMNNPVRSIHYKKVHDYEAPGIAVYPGGARFLACGHYYNNVVTSKVRLTDLDLVNLHCNFTALRYYDPHYPDIERHVTIMRGPTSFTKREAIFLHFELDDPTRDFFTVSYFVFPKYDDFAQLNSSAQGERIVAYHRYVPTFALSSGLRMWIKLVMSESHVENDIHIDFKVEYSVVKFHDRRPLEEQNAKLFFIFFEWKNDIIEQSYLVYTTTPWSIGAGLCGVFLTLHRGYQLAQTSYKRMQKDKARRSIRKRTIKEMRRQLTIQASRQDSEQESVVV